MPIEVKQEKCSQGCALAAPALHAAVLAIQLDGLAHICGGLLRDGVLCRGCPRLHLQVS